MISWLRALVAIDSTEVDSEWDRLALVCATERVKSMQLAYEIQELTTACLAAQARYDSLALTREEVSM